MPGFKSKLSSLTHTYSECNVDSKEFSPTKEHMIALSNLKKNKDIVICKSDKGSGVVILDMEDYNSKMLIIEKREKILQAWSIAKLRQNLFNRKEITNTSLRIKKVNSNQ